MIGYDDSVKILDQLQEPRKSVTKSMDVRQTEWDGRQTEWDGRQIKSICVRAELAAPNQPGGRARFTVKTGDNRQLTVIDRLANSNTIANQSTRLTNTLIKRKANYMKQYFRRGYLSLIV